jgi:hypothetical protein
MKKSTPSAEGEFCPEFDLNFLPQEWEFATSIRFN